MTSNGFKEIQADLPERAGNGEAPQRLKRKALFYLPRYHEDSSWVF